MDLVATHQPLNLGQGFPDYPATGYIPSVLAEVAGSNNNAFHQYTRGYVRLFSSNLIRQVVQMNRVGIVTFTPVYFRDIRDWSMYCLNSTRS